MSDTIRPEPDEVSIIFEGAPNIHTSRENYDNQRGVGSLSQSVCHAPFVSIDIRSSGFVAPCRYSAMNLGNIQEHSLQTIWTSQAFLTLREQFKDYRVRNKECSACVESWLDGLPSDSHAVAEFQRFPMPEDSVAPPRLVSLDLRAPNLESVCQTVIHWLPNIDCLDLATSWPPPEPFYQILLDQVMALPEENRPRVIVRTEKVIPKLEEIPRGVACVELGFPMDDERLPGEEEQTLEALASVLKEQGVALTLVVSVHQANWMHLRAWLDRAKKIGGVLLPQLLFPPHARSFARLDGDSLSCLHGVFLKWFNEFPLPSTQEQSLNVRNALLIQIHRWQRESAALDLPRTTIVFPHVMHSVIQDESTFEPLLGSMLRIYADPAIESWLMEITQSKNFIENGRKRRSLRLVALWLACVFNRVEALSFLHEIFRSPQNAQRVVEEDRQDLTGTSWENWFAPWAKQVGLVDLKIRRQHFQVGTIQSVTHRQSPCVTIIISAYNHEKFIRDTVSSVLGQTRTDFRLWVVDDDSGDESVKVVRKIKDRRLKVIRNKQNLGLGRSLAGVLEKVDTEYVALLDGDDLFHPGRLEKCMTVLSENPQYDLVATGILPVDAQGRICSEDDSSPIFDGQDIHNWLRWFGQSTQPDTASSDLLGALLKRNFLITTSNILARTDFLRQQQPHWENLEFCVDWELFLAAALQGSLWYLKDPLLGNRLHQKNVRWWDGDRQWKFYLESNQLFSRILDLLFQQGDASGAGGFNSALKAIVEHLRFNQTLDWPGVFLGQLLERSKQYPRDLKNDVATNPLRTLIQEHNFRLETETWLQQNVGHHVPDLYRMHGERPYLRSIRNVYEVLQTDYERIQGLFFGLLSERTIANKDGIIVEEKHASEILSLRQKIEAMTQEMKQILEEQGKWRSEEELKEELHQLHRQTIIKEELLDSLVQLKQRTAERDNMAKSCEHLTLQLDATRANEEGFRTKLKESIAEREELNKLSRELQQGLEEVQHRSTELQEQVGQREGERDGLRSSLEYRAGALIINRLSLGPPLRKGKQIGRTLLRRGRQIVTTLENRLNVGQLTAERHWRGTVGNQYRMVATVCWNFPIYSQTFVYQELTQLARHGFDVRLIYSKLDSQKYLHPQFAHLWNVKRKLVLRREIHEQDFSRYMARMPEKVQALIQMICEVSGLSTADLTHHGNFLEAFSFTRMVEAYRPHYIHSYFFYDRSFMALIASYLLDIPRGMSCYVDHLLKDYELKLVPLHMELCDVVIATSERIKAELLTLAPHADPERILVKPNAIDTTWFPIHPRTDPEKGSPFRLICVSRIEPKKGLLYLIDAVHELHRRGWQVECHLIGEPDQGVDASQAYKAKVDERISELNLWGRVHLEGFQNEAGVKRFLNLSHLFVVPFVETATGDKDGIPTALLEGMSTGLPVVATDSGSIAEVVDDGLNGVLVPQRDSVALANAIESLLRDLDRRHRYGHAAAEMTRQCFDVGVCEGKFHDRVRSIIKARG